MDNKDWNNKTIVISRTDSIGDVVLTLPICGWLKEKFPYCRIVFLGQRYTQPVVTSYSAIDEFIAWDKIEELPVTARVEVIKQWNADAIIHVFPNKELAKFAKKAKVPVRIGTSHRSFHFLNCNVRPNFTRKNAGEHEAQLNFHLIKYFGIQKLPTLAECSALIGSYFKPTGAVKPEIISLIDFEGKNIVLHPRSKGSAIEWHIDNYEKLAITLAKQGFTVFFSGTEQEGASFRGKIPSHPLIHDLTGKLSLPEFIAFLSHIDAIVACSTGPLHLASILGKKAIGLYTTQRPMHPGRWQPLGEDVHILVDDTPIDDENEKFFLTIPVQDVIKSLALEVVG